MQANRPKEITHWRERRPWPGLPVPEHNLHLTLAFLGEADEATQAKLITAAGQQRCPPFTDHREKKGFKK